MTARILGISIWRSLILGAMLMASGCAGPKQRLLSHDALLDKAGGPLLVVDACIFHDAIGDDEDYYLVAESNAGAEAVITAAKSHLAEKGVTVRAAIAPFVCGVLHDDAELLVPVMPLMGGERTRSIRPFALAAALKSDTEYAAALIALTTEAYKQGVEKDVARLIYAEQPAARPKFSRNYSPVELREAAGVIAKRTQAASAVFVSVHGYTQSSAKSSALTAGRALVGLVSLVASGGTVLYIPGSTVAGRVMAASAFDLADGRIIWSESFRVNGPSRTPEEIASVGGIERLLRELLHLPDARRPDYNPLLQ